MLLALDPSSSCTGWAIFESGKCVSSGFIRLPEADRWEETLHREILRVYVENWLKRFGIITPDLEPNFGPGLKKPRLTVLIEDIANRSNRNQYFGPSLFQWAKAVGVCFGSLGDRVEWKRYDSRWLERKPYAKSKLAREKKFRIQCAQAYRPQVSQVDEATAVLFGVWFQTADPRLFEWKPPAKKPRRRDGKLELTPRIPPPGRSLVGVPPALIPSRPGRRLNLG